MTENDFQRTARAWLAEGPTEISDRAIEDALARIHVTPRRRAGWPARGLPPMTNFMRVAAVVAVIAVAGLAVASLRPSGTGTFPLPTPSPTPTPLRTLTLGETPALLDAGTYVAGDPFPNRVTVTVPDGWTGNIGGPFAVFLTRTNPTAEVDLQIFDKVYADPCDIAKGLLDPLPGPSVDDLVTALTQLPGGMSVSTPADVTISGYHGKQVTITAPPSIGTCNVPTSQAFRLWQLPLGATTDLGPKGSFQVSVLDVAGRRMVLLAAGMQAGTTTLQPAVQSIVDSIRIEPGG
jgi:hypothetical protein